MLEPAINDYLLWMISKEYAESTWKHYDRVLNHFLDFVNKKAIVWGAVFTFDTLNAFQEHCQLSNVSAPIRGLSRYLFQQGRIDRPIKRQFKGCRQSTKTTLTIIQRFNRSIEAMCCVRKLCFLL
jgi:hypothetical protein